MKKETIQVFIHFDRHAISKVVFRWNVQGEIVKPIVARSNHDIEILLKTIGTAFKNTKIGILGHEIDAEKFNKELLESFLQ